MKNREISSKLLEKYIEDSATEQERDAVEQWLNAETFDEVESSASFQANKEQIKKEIWNNLPPGQTEKIKRFPRSPKTFRYAAAAAVIFCLTSFGLLHLLTDSNHTASSQQIVQVCDHPTFIPVENDTEILFVSETSGANKLSQKMACKEGNTYLAIKVKFRSEEKLLVVNEKDIQHLPPFLNLYIANQIKS